MTSARANATKTNDVAVVARRRLFSSAHFYQQERLTATENRQIFGECFSQYGHGHNYTLEVHVQGPINPKTRLVMNLADLDQILIAATTTLDHKHLNFVVPEFKKTVPTTENIAMYLLSRCQSLLGQHRADQDQPALTLKKIRLFETDDLWVEIYA